VTHILRVVRAGLVAALAVALAGWGLTRARFGASDADAAARVERDVRRRVDDIAETLRAISTQVAAERETIRNAPRDQAALRRLFDLTAGALPAGAEGAPGITVYDKSGAPLAWAGRVTELPKERTTGPATVLLAQSALGPRLVRVEPLTVAAASGVESASVPAAVVVEQSIAGDEPTPPAGEAFAITTAIARVRLRQSGVADRPATAPRAPARTQSTYTFAIPSIGGGVLVEAEVSAADLARERDRWERFTAAAVLGVLALMLLLCAGPAIDARSRARTPLAYLIATAALVGVIVAARALLWIAGVWATGARSVTTPVELLLTAAMAAAIASLILHDVARRRATPRRRALLFYAPDTLAIVAAVFALSGFVDGWILWLYDRGLQRIVSRTDLDLLHFSLHPINGPRLALAFAIVLLHAAVIWTAAAVALYPSRICRTPRDRGWQAAKAAAWLGGAGAAILIANAGGAPIPNAPAFAPLPIAPIAVALLVAAACAVTVSRIAGRVRRASQSARIFMLFLALLAPAVALYPSIVTFATEAKERLVSTVLAPEVASQRQDLERRLRRSLDEIDTMPGLADFVSGFDIATPTTDRAFLSGPGPSSASRG